MGQKGSRGVAIAYPGEPKQRKNFSLTETATVGLEKLALKLGVSSRSHLADKVGRGELKILPSQEFEAIVRAIRELITLYQNELRDKEQLWTGETGADLRKSLEQKIEQLEQVLMTLSYQI